MRPFAYSAPATLGEAVAMLGHSARPLAGGTDLLPLMKAELAAPETVVSVSRLLPRGIEDGGEGLAIGAATTLSEIERDARVTQRYAALAQAAGLAASPQLRNMATLGGNLLQRPRCWYFRQPHARCWLKGGETCFARNGQNREHALFATGPCVAVHPSDPAAALLAFDGDALARGRRNERRLLLDELFAAPEDARRRETIVEDDELVLAIRLPPQPPGTRSVYLKAMDRQAFAFALVGVAAVARLEGGKIAHVRLVLAGVAPVPWRARPAERLLVGAEPTEPLVRAAADAALRGAAPLSGNAWKIPLARALLMRALSAVTGGERTAGS